MNDDLSAKDFLILCSIGFCVVCVLVAYLLYWFIRKSKSERFSKIKFRSRKSKSLGKAARRSKLAEEQKLKTAKKAPKIDEEAFVKAERRAKDESSASSLNKSLRQVELQEQELQQASAKAFSEQPPDYGADVRAMIFKQQQQQGTFLLPPEYSIEVAQPPPPPPPQQKIPQMRLPSEVSKREKSLVLVEPNKFLKEAGIAPDQEKEPPVKERLKAFGSRVDGARSNLMAKKMDSVVAYQTSPISLEQEADLTPSTLNANAAASSKFMSKTADDSGKNTTSILSVANSQMPRETSESFIVSPSKSGYNLSSTNHKSNIANDGQRTSSNISYASSKEATYTGTTSSSSSGRTKDDSHSRRHESKKRQTN